MPRRPWAQLLVPPFSVSNPSDLGYRPIEKPWGQEYIQRVKPLRVKWLFVRRDGALSLQYHHQRAEALLVFSGKLAFDDGTGDEIELTAGDMIWVPRCAKHRVIGLVDSWLYEVGEPSPDSDIVRLKDDYGRAGKAT